MSASPSVPAGGSQWLSACARHYTAIAAAILCLTALNLGVRLGSEAVTEWDEAFYATSAAEMVSSGDWIGTTLQGHLDYYNTKPPLNVWLIALSFKAFGVSLVSLRMASAVCAWLTVFIAIWWAKRLFSPAVAVVTGAVLSVNFGFIYVHSARSGNTDAVLALLMLLTVVTLWAARRVPSRVVWLGPVIAAIFLLKGMAVLMALLIVAMVEWLDRASFRERRRYLLMSLPIFAAPIAAWVMLRWQVDRWEFAGRVIGTDFVGHAFNVLEGHGHGPLFYLDILQKNEYAWLAAAVAALFVVPLRWPRWRQFFHANERSTQTTILAVWAGVTFMVPTFMGTKLPWYLNSFYPAFALGIAWILVRSLSWTLSERRRVLLGAFVAVVFVAGEARLAWHSVRSRDLRASAQGLLFAEKIGLTDHFVFAEQWPQSDSFVARNVLAAGTAQVRTPMEFLERSAAGDYLLWRTRVSDPTLVLVATNGQHWLYRRSDSGSGQ